MQLHIRHESLYFYREPVKRSIQNLCRIVRYVSDYLDACPLRGVRRGGGLESMRAEVTVSPSAQQQQQQQQ
jgi:hypothetical protein